MGLFYLRHLRNLRTCCSDPQIAQIYVDEQISWMSAGHRSPCRDPRRRSMGLSNLRHLRNLRTCCSDPQIAKIHKCERRPRVNMERDAQTYAIIGAAMAVHGSLGHGFLEPVYQEALGVELELRSIPYAREVAVPIRYRGVLLRTAYRADFICFDDIIVELKALPAISGIQESQVIHYLKATGLNRALLVNFGAPRLEYRRLVLSSRHL
jgi:GxxExxY protein